MTMLRILALGTKMVFLKPDLVYFWILSLASASSLILSSCSRSDLSMVSLARSLPFTCTTISMVLDVRYFSSHLGHSSLPPSFSSISEARCGAKGLSSLARTMTSSATGLVL